MKFAMVARRQSATALIGVLAMTTLVTSPATAGSATLGSTAARQSAASFVTSAVVPSGAIASHSDQQHLNPYLANYAAWGFSSQCSKQNFATATGQLRWYAQRSAQGPVTDYTVTNGAEQSTGDADSTDAYDATFLSAFATAWHAAGRKQQRGLTDLRPGVKAATKRILALQDSDGLTWAKPTYKVKYLMDQVEVYWGLSLIGRSGYLSKTQSHSITKASKRVKQGIKSLWNPAMKTYSFAKHENGTVVAADPSIGYPDAASQLWVMKSKIPSAARSRAIATAISGTLGALSSPEGSWVVNGQSEQVGYWPFASTTYSVLNNAAGLQNFAVHYAAVRQQSHGAWPYNVGVAGMEMLPVNPLKSACAR